MQVWNVKRKRFNSIYFLVSFLWEISGQAWPLFLIYSLSWYHCNPSRFIVLSESQNYSFPKPNIIFYSGNKYILGLEPLLNDCSLVKITPMVPFITGYLLMDASSFTQSIRHTALIDTRGGNIHSSSFTQRLGASNFIYGWYSQPKHLLEKLLRFSNVAHH